MQGPSPNPPSKTFNLKVFEGGFFILFVDVSVYEFRIPPPQAEND